MESIDKEYKEELEKFEEIFFELERIKPIDFTAVYILLPAQSKHKKKTLIWGFSLAKKCNSKVFIVTKPTQPMKDVVNRVSKAMDVEYEFVTENVDTIMKEIKKGTNITVIPKDIVKGMEREQNPIFIV